MDNINGMGGAYCQAENGSLMVYERLFYRPEEAEKKEGGTWETRDARELFYSSSLNELAAYNVMHKCIIYLVPLGKTLPDRKEQPSFVVQKFYDFEMKKVRNLTETDCEGILLQPGATETSDNEVCKDRSSLPSDLRLDNMYRVKDGYTKSPSRELPLIDRKIRATVIAAISEVGREYGLV